MSLLRRIPSFLFKFKEFTVSLAQHLTKTFQETEVEKKWFTVDAAGQTLGRIASRVAHILRGKHKPVFTTNTDCGDFVIVLNADKVRSQASALN